MFDDKKMPSKPYDEAVTKVQIKMKDTEKQEFLQKVWLSWLKYDFYI